jgi:hypothetical protein
MFLSVLVFNNALNPLKTMIRKMKMEKPRIISLKALASHRADPEPFESPMQGVTFPMFGLPEEI